MTPGRVVTGFDVAALLDFWGRELTDDGAALGEVRRLYTDPVTINGNPVTATELITRARSLRAAIGSQRRELLVEVNGGDRIVVAFRLTGIHIGSLSTSTGVIPASGRELALRIIDILTLVDGRISDVVMVADELGALSAAGLVGVLPGSTP